MERDPIFLKYAKRFACHGYRLFMVGGTSRDFLLGRPYDDHDFATNATPEEMKLFLPEANYRFAKFGSVSIHNKEEKVDITTLREEGEYKDSRHPSYVKFVTDPKIDSYRRDFTINAIYLDEEGHVFDFHGGISDLKEGIIRFIGDPFLRVKEDPLRILRAERFAASLGFKIEENTLKAINELRPLLELLNKDKIQMEEKKK